MGGSVNVESEIGVGTTFIVKLKTKCKYVDQNNSIVLAKLGKD